MKAKKETKEVFTGIARSKGRAAGEALVSTIRMGWAANHVPNHTGIISALGSNVHGQCAKGKIMIYPTVSGSTAGTMGLFYKVKESKVGPAAIICQKVHFIDMAGAIAGEIPAVDSLDADPIQAIQTGDWVEIDAPEIGQEASVTVTYKNARSAAIRTSRPAAMQKKSLKLKPYEQEMLDGRHGKAKRYAMEKIVQFGIAVGAEEMVPISMAHFINFLDCDPNTPDYSAYEFGQAALMRPFLEFGEKVAEGITCSMDPYLCQIGRYDEEGLPWNCSGKKLPRAIYDARVKGNDAGKKMGWVTADSCTVPMNISIPKFGEYCSSCESSAAAYINTIIGARTNRENAATGLYAAYAGVLPKYGMMLDDYRRPKVILELEDKVKENMSDSADWAALGAAIAIKCNNEIPAVLNMPRTISNMAAKQLTSCVSPGMNDPMLHLIGLSPESPTLEAAFGGKVPKKIERVFVTLDYVQQVYRDLTTAKSNDVQIVLMGCPLLSYEEVRQIARLIEGKKVKKGVHLWVQTDTASYHLAQEYGETGIIEKAGGKVMHQTCSAMLMISGWDEKVNIATNSFKYVKLFGGLGSGWIFGSVPDLINAAVTGKFISTRW